MLEGIGSKVPSRIAMSLWELDSESGWGVLMNNWATSTLMLDETFVRVGSIWRMFETGRISRLLIRAFAKVAGVSRLLKGWGCEEASLMSAGDSPVLTGTMAEGFVGGSWEPSFDGVVISGEAEAEVSRAEVAALKQRTVRVVTCALL